MLRRGVLLLLNDKQQKLCKSSVIQCYQKYFNACQRATIAQNFTPGFWKSQNITGSSQKDYDDSGYQEAFQEKERSLLTSILLSVVVSYVGISNYKQWSVKAAKPFGVTEAPENVTENIVKSGSYEKDLLTLLEDMSDEIADMKKKLAAINSNPRGRYNFFSDAVEKVFPSVVSISVKDYHWHDWGLHQPARGTGSTGSGFIVSSDGRILTNAHVVASNRNSSIQVTLNDGRNLPAVVEDIDYAKDLAVIRVSCGGLKPIKFGKSSEARTGEFVAALGSPLSLRNTVTVGVVSSKAREARSLGIEANEINYIQTDAAITYGNSGGPLVNLDAEVIGVNSMKLASGISFAIPIEYALAFLDESFARQKLGKALPLRPYMGLTVLTLNDQLKDELKERTGLNCSEFGVLVWQVVVGSPAYRAGIQPGDVITQVNGNVIKTASGLYESAKLAATLRLHVQRGNKLYVCTVNPELVSDM